MMTATARLLEEIVSVGTRLAVRFDDARRELEAEQRQRRECSESPMLADKFEILEKLLREMREENTKSITELKNELAAEREDSHKSITELKYELAAERAAREEKVKEVAALTARLSQAEKTLLHQKDETCKIWEAIPRASCQSTTGTDAQDEARALRKEMENVVKALTTQLAQAEDTRVQQQEESRKLREAIYLTSQQPPTKTDAKIIHADENTTVLQAHRFDEPLTDCGLLHLPHLTSLKRLEISHCVYNTALRHLYTVTWLEELQLKSDIFDDSVVLGISNLTALCRLELIDTRVSDEGLVHLTCLGSLKVLNITRGKNKFSSAGMVHLGNLTVLEELKLESYNFDDSMFLGVSNMTALRRLELIHTRISDDGMAHLTRLGSLKVLNLTRGKSVSSAGMVHLGKLASLEELKLESYNFSDSVVQEISNLTALRRLELSAAPFSDNGLAHLTRLGSLKVLILSGGNNISAAGMVHLGKLTSLEALDIGGLSVKDNGTWNEMYYDISADLPPLSKLAWLALSGRVTDQGMKHLTCFESLKTIWLRSSYSDSHRFVGHLKNLSGLETVGVKDSQTAEMLSEFLPNVHVMVFNYPECNPA